MLNLAQEEEELRPASAFVLAPALDEHPRRLLALAAAAYRRRLARQSFCVRAGGGGIKGKGEAGVHPSQQGQILSLFRRAEGAGVEDS